MSEHAQALMLSTRVRLPNPAVVIGLSDSLPQVHTLFGYTLMLAGVTRIIEVSFIVPKYYPLPEGHATPDDNHSEHTLTEGAPSPSSTANVGLAFRHLPPFVSLVRCSCNMRVLMIAIQLLVASG